MNMKRTVFLLGTLLAFFVGTPALAQTTLYLHGGAGVPSSSAFNDAYNTGFNLGAAAGLPITSNLEGVLMGRYDRFGLDAPSGVDGGAFSALSATANLKYNTSMMGSRFTPYAFGGAGLFRSAFADIESALGNLDGDSELNLGLQAGVGMGVMMSPRTSLLVEPNYVRVFNEGQDTQYFPIRLGVSLRV